MIFKALSNLIHSDFMVLQSPSHTGCILIAGPVCAGDAHTISISDAGYRGLSDAKEMPVPSHFNPCPKLHSLSLLWRWKQKHIPKGTFWSFYRKWQLYRHIYMTRDRKAKGEARPPLAAQVGREGSFVGKGVAASPLVAHSGTSCHTTRRLKKKTMAESPEQKREQRQGEGEEVGCGDLFLPQPSHSVGSFCGWDTDVYTLGIPLGRGMCV